MLNFKFNIVVRLLIKQSNRKFLLACHFAGETELRNVTLDIQRFSFLEETYNEV
jgi:hypothetical protein